MVQASSSSGAVATGSSVCKCLVACITGAGARRAARSSISLSELRGLSGLHCGRVGPGRFSGVG